MTTIYLIRHGEIPTHSPRRFIGRTDLQLTQYGREQISLLGKYLQQQSITAIISSPLARCCESAEILAKYCRCVPEINPNLAELDLGDWEGLTVAEVQKRYPGNYEARGRDIAYYRPPSGESFADLLQRVYPAFIRATDGDRCTAVVAHAGVNRVLLCRLLGMPLDNLFRLQQNYGCCNVIHRSGDFFQLECIR